MEKRWDIKKFDQERVSSLQESLGIHPTICNLLVQRGIHTYNEAKAFFRPSINDLHDPFLMRDMDLAITRIEQAMVSDERILIYGDYDVDGTTSVTLAYKFFSEIYENIDFYIPDRYREGYGISEEGIEYASYTGVSLIIALDCGIKAVENVQLAKNKGIDFIICDHHRPGDQLPPAIAVLDPKREDCSYPFDELSGCGIGFKLIQAFASKNNIPFEYLMDYLDLVVVSIASDIVPIVGENRTLAYYGLKVLNDQPRPGIRSLLRLAGSDKKLEISDIVFVIGPRINAAGRLASAADAVKLLLSKEEFTAQERAHKIEIKNTKRRQIDSEITKEAMNLMKADPLVEDRKSTVLYNAEWHKGVIGIVASRLIEQYYRPTIILTSDNGMASGSCRSVPGFDIYNAISECSDLIERYGGHKYAAGLTIKVENIPAFKSRFESVVEGSILDTMLVPEIRIDAELDLTSVNEKFYNIIQQFSPFGPGNMKPVFVSYGLRDTGKSSQVGVDRRHLKIQATQHDSAPVSGIAFNMGDKYNIIAQGLFDVCYSMDLNDWNGIRSIQMHVKDIKAHNGATF